MGLESFIGVYIDGLNTANPVGASDTKSQGDDHIRGIKLVLQNTFPEIDGAVNSTPTELNYLDGSTPGTAVASKALVVDANLDIDLSTGDLTAVDVTASGTITGDLTGNVTGNADTATATQALKVGGANGTMEVFISSAYTYTSNGQVLANKAHGLSGTPQEIFAVLKCVDNSVDTWAVEGQYYAISNGTTGGIAVTADGTNVSGCTDDSDIRMNRTDTGVGVNLSTGGGGAADWEIYIIAKYYA